MNIDRLITLFRFPCPTSSATWAQVWFELRSSGLRVIAIGLAMVVLIYFLFAISVSNVPFRPFATICAVGSVPAALLLFARNAFGIRRKQKRAYISAFEATQPCSTAQLAGVKLIVRTACVLVALVAIGGSAWKSSSLMNAWGPWSAEDTQNTSQRLLHDRKALGDDWFGSDGYEFAVQVVNTLVFVIGVVVALAAFSALAARYPRRVRVAGALLLLWLLALRVGTGFLPPAFYSAIPWIVVTAMLFATGYFLWSGFKERALTTGYLCGALVIAMANSLPYLHRGSDTFLVTLLLPLLPLVLAPWAFSRIRHL